MSSSVVVVIVILAVIVIAIAAYVGYQRTQRRRLQDRFGPEYERRIDARGDRRAAEHELRDIVQQRDKLNIRPLDPELRNRYATNWAQVQSDFVDHPTTALQAADQLVGQVMRDRGYPVEDFDRQADMVAVDHPGIVEHYRAATLVRQRSTSGDVSTEEQRRAFVHYRELFSDLLSDDDQQNGRRMTRGETR